MNHDWFLKLVSALGLAGIMSFPVYAADCDSLDELDWLMGRWESRTKKSVTTETWVRVSEDTAEVLGQSFSLPDFNQTFLESIRVAPLSGEIFYIAKVSHNEYPIPFKLTDCSPGLAVFEKPDQDFPTSITYQLLEPGRLRVDVSGPDGKGFSVPLAKKSTDKRIALTFDDAPRSDSQRFSGTQRTRALIENLAGETARQ